jgi:hypothetical protein
MTSWRPPPPTPRVTVPFIGNGNNGEVALTVPTWWPTNPTAAALGCRVAEGALSVSIRGVACPGGCAVVVLTATPLSFRSFVPLPEIEGVKASE